MLEDTQVEALEDMIFELLLGNNVILHTLFKDKIQMTMSTHVVIRAQDDRCTKVRDNFEKYIRKYDTLSKNLKKRFEEIEKFGLKNSNP